MNMVLLACIIVLTISVVVAVVFLIQTLIQMRRTANQAEILLKNVNEEIGIVKGFTSNISSFLSNFNSPWFKTGAWVTSIISILLKNKISKKDKKESGKDPL